MALFGPMLHYSYNLVIAVSFPAEAYINYLCTECG